MTILECREILMLIFTYLHTDLIRTHSPRWETTDVDFYFTTQVQTSIHHDLLRKYVLYKLPLRYDLTVEIDNPLIAGNNYLPGTMYFRTHLFSDLIPLVLSLLNKETLRKIGTYRKILIRRFVQLQESSFNNWNEFFQILQQPMFKKTENYNSRNRIDEYFIKNFLDALNGSTKLSFYLNYTASGRTNAHLF